LLLTVGAAAQTQLRGTWTAEVNGKHPNELQLNLYRSSKMQMGNTMAISDLRGLSDQAIHAPNTPVKFELVRDAGNVQLEGTFDRDLGHGTFVFSANQEYLSAMKQMGYSEVDSKAFELTMLDVSRAYAAELHGLGYKPSLEKLIEARIFNANREQVEGLKTVGVSDLSLDKLVQYRIFDVTPDYVREMRASFPNLSMDKLVEMRIFKATPEFSKEMASLGYGSLTSEQLVNFKIHGVTPEFIREVGELGFKNLDADQLVNFRIFGVNAEQIRELAKEGYNNLTAEQLVNFRIHHVDTVFIERVKKAGYQHPSPDQLVEFKIMGIRVREADL
jgi:cold shock CspA family protein